MGTNDHPSPASYQQSCGMQPRQRGAPLQLLELEAIGAASLKHSRCIGKGYSCKSPEKKARVAYRESTDTISSLTSNKTLNLCTRGKKNEEKHRRCICKSQLCKSLEKK